MFKNVSIIGDGAMGTVLGMLLCENKVGVRIWGYDGEQLRQMESDRENTRFLPGYKLPADLGFETADEKIMEGADLLISAVPCQFNRSIWSRLKDHVPAGVGIVSVAKGIENGSLLRPSQILAEVLGETDNSRFCSLSGPTIADELARKLPATACAASASEELARNVQHTFNCSWLRVYMNLDIVGVELAGAMKNIIAIAAGIVDGIGAGDNAKAALLSRGLTEITRLGLAMGASPQTFAGLTGLGDLVTTCISPCGRNRSFGERIGQGQSIEEAAGATESVVEGIATCQSVVQLAARVGVEIPITGAVHEILFEKKSVQQAINDLMSRELKAE